MDLDKKWYWKNRVLDCRVRPETGNPSGDDLRERLAQLTGVPLNEILASIKTEKKLTETKSKGTVIDYEKEKKFKELLKRTHIAGAAQLAITTMSSLELKDTKDKSKKNKNKAFTIKPKSPGKRILMDALRETGKPVSHLLPDSDEAQAAALRLEKKLAKARLARKEQLDEANKAEEYKIPEAHEMFMSGLMNSCLPPYKGDLFGTGGDYFSGTLYLSRMANSTEKASRKKKLGFNQNSNDNDDEKLNEKNDNQFFDQADSMDLTVSDNKIETEMSAKLYCALVLCNWSRNPVNAERLAAEGAVKAIIKLSSEKNSDLIKYISACFRYMSEFPILANLMIDEGAIRVMTEATIVQDDFILNSIAIALINLTRINGREHKLIDEGIINAFLNIMKNSPELGPACCRGIYNLTCVDAPFQLFEKILLAINEISVSGSSSIKHICAAAVCNLSDLPTIRSKMIELHTLPMLNVLTRGTDLRTRRVCAVILQNFSSTLKCRTEMVLRNCVQTMYNLSSDNDPVILRCIAVALSRLALDSTNCIRIVNDGGTMALCNIAVKFPTVAVISYPTALAFELLASRASTRVTIAQEGSIVAISSLLRQSNDRATLQKSLLALCNLLIEPDTHLVIMQQGLITLISNISSNEDESLRELVALAFVNLSLSSDSHKHIINSGGVASIISLSKWPSLLCKRRSTAALCSLSGLEVGAKRMVEENVIPVLADLLRFEDEFITRYACAAICRMCSSSDNCEQITSSGAVPLLVQRTINGDAETRKFCGSTFSFLSFYEACRTPLCDNNVLDALKVLAHESDESSRLRCLATFGNLSCQSDLQLKLVEEGIVSIIADLANSYQESSLLCCAKALCNLSCCSEARLQVVKDGGAQALMMIGMVRSSDLVTKTVCVTALANLVDEVTSGYLVSEGIVQTLSNLCKQPDPKSPDPNLLKICVLTFNLLSFYDEPKISIADKSSTLMALFNTYDSCNDESKIICARTVANLTNCEAVHSKVLEAGAMRILELGISLECEDTSLHCLNALFLTACTVPKFRQLLSRSLIPSTLIDIALNSYGEKYTVCIKILSVLAWYDNSRIFLQTDLFFSSVLNLVLINYNSESAESFAQILFYLSIDFPFVDQLNLNKLTESINTIYESDNSPKVIKYIVSLIRELSKLDSCVGIFTCPETIAIFHQALQNNPVSDFNLVYDIVTTLLRFATINSDTRVKISSSSIIIEIIHKSFEEKKITEILAALICAFCLDQKSRHTFSHENILNVIVKLFDYIETDDSQYNNVTTVYSISKIPDAREKLIELGIDKKLSKVIVTDNITLKANCSRALKALSSDAAESLEEGTVSSLIAMSLEGKSLQLKEEVLQVEVSPQNFKYNGPPTCIYENGEFSQYQAWKETHQVRLGGSAGKGPPAPDPPEMESESIFCNTTASETDNKAEDNPESEGRSKMAFAKMQIPNELKQSYLLSDDFFKSEEEKLSKISEPKTDSHELTLKNEPEKIENIAENLEIDTTGELPPLLPNVTTTTSPSISSRKSIRKSIRANSSPKNTPKSSPKSSPTIVKRKSLKDKTDTHGLYV